MSNHQSQCLPEPGEDRSVKTELQPRLLKAAAVACAAVGDEEMLLTLTACAGYSHGRSSLVGAGPTGTVLGAEISGSVGDGWNWKRRLRWGKVHIHTNDLAFGVEAPGGPATVRLPSNRCGHDAIQETALIHSKGGNSMAIS